MKSNFNEKAKLIATLTKNINYNVGLRPKALRTIDPFQLVD
jgi:hypothetical protein